MLFGSDICLKFLPNNENIEELSNSRFNLKCSLCLVSTGISDEKAKPKGVSAYTNEGFKI